MNKMIDYDLTISKFLDSAISFLNGMDFAGEKYKYERIVTLNRMNNIKRDPKKYTTAQEIYSNMGDFMGFIERDIKYDLRGTAYLNENNDVFHAVIHVLDAIGKYYEADYIYTRQQLLKSLKEYNIAIGRKNLAKKIIRNIMPETYFAAKASTKQK